MIKACLTHAHSLYAGLTGVWCLEAKHEHRSWLTEPPPASAHTDIFDYCDISLWPTTALTASFITDVSYWHVGWFLTSFASSGLLWMTELCNKSYLFFQTSAAKLLSCTDYEIITKTIVLPETLFQLQWHILWRSLWVWCSFQYQPIVHFLATKLLHSGTS
jgi:hypothetical protein